MSGAVDELMDWARPILIAGAARDWDYSRRSREAEVDAAVRAGLSQFEPTLMLTFPETDRRFTLSPAPCVIDAILTAWREQHA